MVLVWLCIASLLCAALALFGVLGLGVARLGVVGLVDLANACFGVGLVVVVLGLLARAYVGVDLLDLCFGGFGCFWVFWFFGFLGCLFRCDWFV